MEHQFRYSESSWIPGKKTRRQFYSNRLTEFQLEQNQPAVKRPLTEVRGACPHGRPGRTVRRPSEIDATLSVTLQASRHQILSKTERTRSFQAQQQRALRKKQMDLLLIQVRRRHRTRDWCISRDADQFSILGTCALCDCEHFCWRDCIEFTTTVTISYRDPVFLLALQIVKLL